MDVSGTVRGNNEEQRSAGEKAVKLQSISEAVPGHEAGEMFEGPVVRPFRIIGEAAGGKLPVFEVVLQAFAADALSAAGLVAAVAIQPVPIQLAIHKNAPKLRANVARHHLYQK
ncbi:MAG: hypothetical protein JW793_02615 [Acidobacteria bacterium]|nr:hypothetical protein [Acidobacteriota bacterium]